MNKSALKDLRLFSIFILILFLSLPILAQDSKPTNNKAKNKSKVVQEAVGRPDLPGDLTVELGLGILSNNNVENMDMNLWGSKTFNIYYQYPFQLGSSGFSLNPGIGIGTEKYAFKEDFGLAYTSPANDTLAVTPLGDLFPNASGFKKSKISVNYFDIPIELRWHSRKNDWKRSIKVTVGGKVGFCFDAKTKVKYEETGETKITKQKESWQLEKIRYGIYGKMGYGPIGAFYYYSFSQLWQKNRGPEQTETNPMIFGLYFSLF
jgi:hypothetical protein